MSEEDGSSLRRAGGEYPDYTFEGRAAECIAECLRAGGRRPAGRYQYFRAGSGGRDRHRHHRRGGRPGLVCGHARSQDRLPNRPGGRGHEPGDPVRTLLLAGVHDAQGILRGEGDTSGYYFTESPDSRVFFTPQTSGKYHVAAGGDIGGGIGMWAPIGWR